METFCYVKTGEPIIGAYFWTNKQIQVCVKYFVRVPYHVEQNKNKTQTVLQCGGFAESSDALKHSINLRDGLELFGKRSWKECTTMTTDELNLFLNKVVVAKRERANKMEPKRILCGSPSTFVNRDIITSRKIKLKEQKQNQYFDFVLRRNIYHHDEFLSALKHFVHDSAKHVDLILIHEELVRQYKFKSCQFVERYERLLSVWLNEREPHTNRSSRWFPYIHWRAKTRCCANEFPGQNCDSADILKVPIYFKTCLWRILVYLCERDKLAYATINASYNINVWKFIYFSEKGVVVV
jgi:hypothetical protein